MYEVSRDKMVGWELSGVAISWSLDEPNHPFLPSVGILRHYLPIVTSQHPSAGYYGHDMTHKVSDIRAEKVKCWLSC
jgi:hypothetical protein